jgi:acyl carrier protein
MYATGDVARWRPGGELEVLGRRDGQVKVRGFRIELGEIEAALLRDPAVRQAAVVAPGGAAGRRLVACLVPGDGQDLAEESVRAHLRRLLPEPMIPSTFVSLPALPLTPGGKLDRRALERLASDAGSRQTGEAHRQTPPRTETERLLAGLWAEVLGRERVSIDESFFDLGGHSLLLARVQTKLAETLGREVPLLKLIEHPTVGALAAWLEAEGEAPPAAAAGESRDRAARQRQALELQRQRTARRTGGGIG